MRIRRPAAWLAAILLLSVAATELISDAGVTSAPLASMAGADDHDIKAGDILQADDIHLISQPGRYGLGPEQPGSRYAVVSRTLIRIDPQNLKILSILRHPVAILD